MSFGKGGVGGNDWEGNNKEKGEERFSKSGSSRCATRDQESGLRRGAKSSLWELRRSKARRLGKT